MDKGVPILFVDYCGVRDKYGLLGELSDALAPRPLVVIDGVIGREDIGGSVVAEAFPRTILGRGLQARVGRVLARRVTKVDFSLSPGLHGLVDQLLGLWREKQAHPKRCEAERVLARTYRYTRACLHRRRPGLMIVWNEFHPLSRAAQAAARSCGVPVAFVEYGVLPGTLCFDFSGQMGESDVVSDHLGGAETPLAPDDLRAAEAVLATLAHGKANRRPQMPLGGDGETLLKRASGRPIVLFAGHNDNASGTFPYDETARRYHSPIFETSRQTAEYLAGAARDNGWFLVYKPHPFAAKAQTIEESQHVAVLRDFDIHDCIGLADCVTTTVSQVSYVALFHGKPLAMFGYNQLRGSGCHFQAERLEDVVPSIRAALASGFTEAHREALVRHVARLLRDYLYQFDGNASRLAAARPIKALAVVIDTALDGGLPVSE